MSLPAPRGLDPRVHHRMEIDYRVKPGNVACGAPQFVSPGAPAPTLPTRRGKCAARAQGRGPDWPRAPHWPGRTIALISRRGRPALRLAGSDWRVAAQDARVVISRSEEPTSQLPSHFKLLFPLL